MAKALSTIPRNTSRGTWVAAKRFSRLSKREKFHHPLADQLRCISSCIEHSKYFDGDNLEYYARHNIKSVNRYQG